MSGLAHAFAATFEHGDPTGLVGLMLNRVRMATGFELAVGRDAVMARCLALAGGFEERRASTIVELVEGDTALVALALGGRPRGADVPVAFELHLWLTLEAGRIVLIEAIGDGAAFPDSEAAYGAAHPTHRPLGELASGCGQLADTRGDDLGAQLNARALGGRPDLLELVTAVPDARLTLDRAAGPARLWRLHGHAGGRRVSLPVSSRDGTMLHLDRLALAATPHRPFWPD